MKMELGRRLVSYLLVPALIAAPAAFILCSAVFGPIATWLVVQLELWKDMPLAMDFDASPEGLQKQRMDYVTTRMEACATQSLLGMAVGDSRSTAYQSWEQDPVLVPDYDEQVFPPGTGNAEGGGHEEGADEQAPPPAIVAPASARKLLESAEAVRLQDLKAAAKAAPAKKPTPKPRGYGIFNLQKNYDYFGEDMFSTESSDPYTCGMLCMKHFPPDCGMKHCGCGYFTFRTYDNMCYIKPLRDATGEIQKVEERHIKRSPQHIAGDLSRLQDALCCRPCWRRLQKWLWSAMIIGMTLAAVLMAAVVHDLDLMRQDREELPDRLRIRWMRPYLLQDMKDDTGTGARTAVTALFLVLMLVWIVVASVWTWTCQCDCCHDTALWKAMNIFLIFLWVAAALAFVFLMFAFVAKRLKPKPNKPKPVSVEQRHHAQKAGIDEKHAAVLPPPLQKNPPPPPYKTYHPTVHGWGGYR